MSLATERANRWVSYCLSYQDLIIHEGARPGLLAALKKDWRRLLRSPTYFAETKATGVAAILRTLPADTNEADAVYYSVAAEKLSLTLGELLYASTSFTQVAEKTYIALQAVECDDLGAQLHTQIMSWRDTGGVTRYSADINGGFEQDVALLFSYLISFLKDLSAAIKENFKREKNVKQLEELELPTDTKQLEALVKKAIADKELGELFSWKKVKSHSFQTWMDEWFRGEYNFIYFVLKYLSRLDPEFHVEGPAVRAEKDRYSYYTKGRKPTSPLVMTFNTAGLAAGGVYINAAAAWGAVADAPQAALGAVNPAQALVIDEFVDEADEALG